MALSLCLSVLHPVSASWPQYSRDLSPFCLQDTTLGAAGCPEAWRGSTAPVLEDFPASGRDKAAARVTMAKARGLPGGIQVSQLKYAELGLLSTWCLLHRLVVLKEALLFIITSNF